MKKKQRDKNIHIYSRKLIIKKQIKQLDKQDTIHQNLQTAGGEKTRHSINQNILSMMDREPQA